MSFQLHPYICDAYVSYHQNLTTVAYEHNDKKMESVYSKRIRAGKRRTYFFDVRATKGNDYFLTITESRKRFDDHGYDRHKIFVYKEDFNKFFRALGEAIDFVKTDLMPNYNFDSFNHDDAEGDGDGYYDEPAIINKPTQTAHVAEAPSPTPVEVAPTPSFPAASASDLNLSTEEVDKW